MHGIGDREAERIVISEARSNLNGAIRHGGDVNLARRIFDLGDRPIVDFSASLNPFAPLPRVLEAARNAIDSIARYPEPGAPRLTERIAEIHGVPVDRVIVGAGATEIIGLIGQSLREVLALHAAEIGDPHMPLSHIVEPTYGEYRRISRLNNLRVETWRDRSSGWAQEFLPRSAAGVFWTGHPNNPTGRVWNRRDLLGLIDDTEALLTVVDEAFLPFLTDESERTLTTEVASRNNLLVLRSLTKIHAIPGLRVGYAIASADMIERLRDFQDPWTVSSAAEAAALAAIDVTGEAERRELIEKTAIESAWMLDWLWELQGIRPAWPDRDRPAGVAAPPNYHLVNIVRRGLNSFELHKALAKRGFLTRECSNFPGLEPCVLEDSPPADEPTGGSLRIAVRTRPENEAFLAALASILDERSAK